MTIGEATELINLFKKIEKGEFVIPVDGKAEFDFKSLSTRDQFKISVYRKTNLSKVSYSALLKGQNVMLVRLDITPNGKHRNPNGDIIKGNHIHIYTEEYGDKYAINFNSNNYDVFDNCLEFFREFNIIDTNIRNEITLFN